MILTKEVEVAITYNNIQHYKELGYDIKCGNKIVVPIEHLSLQSNKKIKVKCDVCGKEKEMKYQDYIKSISNGGYYACCSKCAWDKNRKTYIEHYGVDAPMKSKLIQEKSKQTCLEKYGTENISQSDYFKEKYKEVMLEHYGVENAFQSEEIKEKIRQTSLEKYGYEHYRQNQEMKEKYCIGEKCPWYIDGRTSLKDDWDNATLVSSFRRKIFGSRERKCVCCGKEIREMQLHHLNARNKFPEQTFDEDNVVIICKDCHKKFHDKYGYGDNTKEQFEEFLKELNENN